MKPIRINFIPALPASDALALGNDGQHLAERLRTALLAELEAEIAAQSVPDAGFTHRRAAAGHLHWKVAEVSESGLLLSAAPEARLQAAFDHSPELCRLWLEEVVGRWCREQLQAEALQVEPGAIAWPQAAPSLPESRSRTMGRAGGLVTGIAALAFVLLMGTLAWTLFKVYRLVEDVHDSYDQIEQAVDRKTDAILEKIERGITTSDRVVKMMDMVKELAVPPDSAGK